VNESAGEKLWKRRAQTALGNRRSDFHFSHSFNNNKLDDRNHFLQNAKTSVASLRRLITPTRNADHDQPGTLIIFIGIRSLQLMRDLILYGDRSVASADKNVDGLGELVLLANEFIQPAFKPAQASNIHLLLRKKRTR